MLLDPLECQASPHGTEQSGQWGTESHTHPWAPLSCPEGQRRCFQAAHSLPRNQVATAGPVQARGTCGPCQHPAPVDPQAQGLRPSRPRPASLLGPSPWHSTHSDGYTKHPGPPPNQFRPLGGTTSPKDSSSFNPRIQPPRAHRSVFWPWATPPPRLPSCAHTLPRRDVALRPLMQGGACPRGPGWPASFLPPPLSLRFPPLPHDPGPHSTEMNSLVLGLQLSNTQIPRVLGPGLWSRKRGGTWWPASCWRRNISAGISGGDRASAGTSRCCEGRCCGHRAGCRPGGQWLPEMRSRKAADSARAEGLQPGDTEECGHRGRAGHGGGAGGCQLRGFSPVPWSRSPRRTGARTWCGGAEFCSQSPLGAGPAPPPPSSPTSQGWGLSCSSDGHPKLPWVCCAGWGNGRLLAFVALP